MFEIRLHNGLSVKICYAFPGVAVWLNLLTV